MSLRHALLALLEAGPMTGYELAKQFDQSADRVWHAPHPQIYTELRKLEGEGLVAADEQPRGTKAVKRAYRLNPDGERELRRWVSELEAPQQVRDAAYLKATYFEYAEPATVRRHFERHRAHHEEQLQRWERHVAQLQARETELLQRRLAHASESDHEAIVAYKVHVYQGMAERARTEIEWAERGLDLVDKLTS
ncbi:PadR family transcriptional regulator [Amycolatopsis acidiphila]|uniref:PadR family transcriptional regulator n=1 Tax=Amycolatopsis acidiphila TaxID=715473 RepID=A0A558AC13_9PSEU|nr:PadR family transcriptional regulator [Amycolatopsis acidiphila]TVT21775.1 PadR family transcriptional regulator [Amycolatopsis acidiphila]UIJ61493.1 PadR family transcriptional regulator [Amycolatopsis acidiphila]GHG59605.1 transcriptional regulator [Amycolatopsis acidiphila]